MKSKSTCITILAIICSLLFSVPGLWAQQTAEQRCYGRYQLVNGEYDVKIKPASSEQSEYKAHRTMFLVDTDTGRVWLFVAESDATKGRWGWIPSRGVREAERSGNKKE